MNWRSKIKGFVFFDTYGALASVSFLICGLSGILLAVFYDVNDPLNSISTLLITNPAAVFYRNLHYWSAQAFLILTFLHLWDHVKAKSIPHQSHGVWLRLVLSVIAVFFVMISGFILKGDADSQQARRIITSLSAKIPLAGDLISAALFGSSGDYQLIYVHHIATATIFIAIIIWEHAHTLWTRWQTFTAVLILLTGTGIFLHAPLQGNFNEVVKGPWYFVGLQEILHWMSNPAWIWLVILFLLILFYLFFHFKNKKETYLRRLVLYLFYFYLILTLIGLFFRGENWSWQMPYQKPGSIGFSVFRPGLEIHSLDFSKFRGKEIPSIRGRKEACLLCHDLTGGLSGSHDPKALGCTSCHLGNPFTVDKRRAHRDMILIPGNLTDVPVTCGTTDCHPEIAGRITHSLMTSNSGIVSVDRYVFGEAESPDILARISGIQHSAADQHMRNLCSNCHLGKEKIETGPPDELTRGGGCNACHLNYSEEVRMQHQVYLAGLKAENLLPRVHPSIDLRISNDHCFGCHSRSGRISTNYEGWHETLLSADRVQNKSGYRVLQDQRVFEFVSDDIHHAKGMECIDCHVSYELMGDGNEYMHEEQAIKITCEDCHFKTPARIVNYNDLDKEYRKIFDIRNYDKEIPVIGGKDTNAVFLNTFLNSSEAYLKDKNEGKIHQMKPPASICMNKNGHQRLTCSSCHSAWVPQCMGCHNEFDRNADGIDMLDDKSEHGSWIEYVGLFVAEAPALGVRTGDKNQIEPCTPGMIITIDKSQYPAPPREKIFHRLYAPVSPHTTSKKGRGCKSCHNNPVAMGYGRGDLQYKIMENRGEWVFQPKFEMNKNDKLPEDAWIGFLCEPSGINSTRSDFRPLNLREQQKILMVGACLTCHDENTEVILNSLESDFSDYLTKISESCIIPEWK